MNNQDDIPEHVRQVEYYNARSMDVETMHGEVKKITFANGSSITFREFDAGIPPLWNNNRIPKMELPSRAPE